MSTAGPLWLRVAEYAADHADRAGVLLLDAGELRRVMGTSSPQLTRAIQRAVAAGWLRRMSTTRALYVHPAKLRRQLVTR